MATAHESAKEFASQLAEAITKATVGGDLIVAEGLAKMSELIIQSVSIVASATRENQKASIDRDESLQIALLEMVKTQQNVMLGLKQLAERLVALETRVKDLEEVTGKMEVRKAQKVH